MNATANITSYAATAYPVRSPPPFPAVPADESTREGVTVNLFLVLSTVLSRAIPCSRHSPIVLLRSAAGRQPAKHSCGPTPHVDLSPTRSQDAAGPPHHRASVRHEPSCAAFTLLHLVSWS